MCPGAHGGTKCHPGWWQCSSQGGGSHSSEMSLMLTSFVPRGLHMIKYNTNALALAIKMFAVAGREKQCSSLMSSGRDPALIPLSQRPFPHRVQQLILGVTSSLRSTSRSSQRPHLSHLGQSKTPTALAVQFPCFQL